MRLMPFALSDTDQLCPLSHTAIFRPRDSSTNRWVQWERFFELASEPKQIAWYDNCGPEFNAQARLDRVTWLCAQFGLPQPSQDILDLLEQVPSPVPLES